MILEIVVPLIFLGLMRNVVLGFRQALFEGRVIALAAVNATPPAGFDGVAAGIVTVVCGVAPSAASRCGSERRTANDSAASPAALAAIGTAMVFVVSPAAKLTTCDSAVKSAPAVAVPGTVSTFTEPASRPGGSTPRVSVSVSGLPAGALTVAAPSVTGPPSRVWISGVQPVWMYPASPPLSSLT